MNIYILSLKNLFAKPLSSLLSILLFGFGVSIIVSILLASSYLKDEIQNNASGIDLVIGAKGSPLQIILANIFHIDFPTGNISLEDANNISQNRLIESAIPISLGDSHQGYRIVGTTNDYPKMYNSEISNGEWFSDEMTATLGANVAQLLGLSIGDQFFGSHGLSRGSDVHEEHPYTIVGILKPTGRVVDNLILTSIQSVWSVHEHEEEIDHADDSTILLPKLNVKVTQEQLLNEEVTSLLVKYRSPMAAVQLPRIVNGTSNLQAASPPYETARLFTIIGVGIDVVNILGIVIITLSAISVFIALLNSLKERKYELAIIRTMGASRLKIMVLVIMEGFFLTVLGSLFGFVLAHGGFALFSYLNEKIMFSGIIFTSDEYYVLAGSLLVGIFASIIPAIMAYREEISETLAKG